TALTAEFTVGEGKLMTHDEPCSMAPDDKHDLISGTCSHLPLSRWLSPLDAICTKSLGNQYFCC
ncbi:hypothetical protein, partial [Klebsiella quasivariicola]|uniref:hypothetical protein n=1 Tax=Klebsiella quasivariicola TaxID=2026240 RepID=UPI003F598C1F